MAKTHKRTRMLKKFLKNPCPFCDLDSAATLVACIGMTIQLLVLILPFSPWYGTIQTYKSGIVDFVIEGCAVVPHFMLLACCVNDNHKWTYPWLFLMPLHSGYLVWKIAVSSRLRLWDLLFRLISYPFGYIIVYAFMYQLRCYYNFKMSRHYEIFAPPLIVSREVGMRYNEDARMLHYLTQHARSRVRFRNLIPRIDQDVAAPIEEDVYSIAKIATREPSKVFVHRVRFNQTYTMNFPKKKRGICSRLCS